MAKKHTRARKSIVHWHSYSHYLISGSLAAVLLAAVGWLGVDFWLASTQWLLIAGVLAILGVYARLEGRKG